MQITQYYLYISCTGLAALAKVLIAMEDGYIPANLHYNTPNPDIPGLADGRLQVVSQRTKWHGGYVGINSFGFGGSNVHVLLKSNSESQRSAISQRQTPRLITVAARTKQAVEYQLENVCRENNVHLESLVRETSKITPSVQPFRGYTIANHSNKVQETQV